MYIHNFTKPLKTWGYDCFYYNSLTDDNLLARFFGFGNGLKKGDYIILTADDEVNTSIYLIEEIDYFTDRKDQFTLKGKFQSRSLLSEKILACIDELVSTASKRAEFNTKDSTYTLHKTGSIIPSHSLTSIP